MTLQRAQEIEKVLIKDALNGHIDICIEAFKNFITSDEMNDYETITLRDIVEQALGAPFPDRYKPINALVCRAVEWQAERLAKLEQE
jgi:hypothetical protein